jgi:hypothetical protein
VTIEYLQPLVVGVPERLSSTQKPLNEVVVADLVDSRLEFDHVMRKRGGGSVSVPGLVTVWEENESNAPGTENSVHLTQESDGLCEVLQHVAGDDEVLTVVRYRSEPISVEIGDDIGFDEFSARRELREEPLTLVGVPAI